MQRLHALLSCILSGLASVAPAVSQVGSSDVCGGRTVLINQGPTSELAGPTSAAAFQTTAADNFLLTADSIASRIVFWGFYGEPADPESFSVIFRGDDSGIPSFVNVGPTLNGLVPARTEVQSRPGLFEFVVDVEPINLTSGVHWIEIFSTGPVAPATQPPGRGGSSGAPPSPDDQFFMWNFGMLDQQNGIEGFASGFSTLDPVEEGNLAVELCGPGQAPAVPSLGRGGAAILMIIVAMAGAAYLRRQRFNSEC
jgi:hypothetical protein